MSGWSVAMNAAGDTVIIGAHRNDGNGDNAGQARVFTLTDGGGCRSVPISTAKPQTICPARSVAMNAAGDTVIIGAPTTLATAIMRVRLGCSR